MYNTTLIQVTVEDYVLNVCVHPLVLVPYIDNIGNCIKFPLFQEISDIHWYKIIELHFTYVQVMDLNK